MMREHFWRGNAAALLFSSVAGHDQRDPFSVAGPVPDMLGAAESSLKGLRIAWSPTLGFARPQADVVETVAKAVATLEQLGASVDLVETVFDNDPADLWTAEFYAGVVSRLRSFLENQRDLLADRCGADCRRRSKSHISTVPPSTRSEAIAVHSGTSATS